MLSTGTFSNVTAANLPPTGVSPVWNGSDIDLSWLPVTGAQTYNVYRATTPGGEGATPIASGIPLTNYVDSTVTVGKTYYYEVTAVINGQESLRSFEAIATQGVSTTPLITELEAINNTTLADQAGEHSDWLEIYNPATTSVNLGGYYLTNKLSDLTKWEIPDGVTLQPNSFLVVFCDSENITNPSELHTNFNLSGSGASVALVAPNGVTILSSYTFPQELADISYGVAMAQATGPSGNVITSYGAIGFLAPTPGAVNGSLLGVGIAAEPTFDHPAGFYTSSFPLVISSATPDAQIYYTLDGTVPTPTNGTLYTGPITISGESNVRAAAFATGYLSSTVNTVSYIYVAQVIEQEPEGQVPAGWPSNWGGSAVHYGMAASVVDNPLYSGEIEQDILNMPTFSITMNLNDLFNLQTGIYSNPSDSGAAWTKPASIEYIPAGGGTGFQANVGIAIHGGADVLATNDPKRGFRIEFSSTYGASQLSYPLFGANAAQTFEEFDLRTDQNNSWQYPGQNPENYTAIEDAFSSDTMAAMGQLAEHTFSAAVYINGQFWGLYDPIERPNEDFAASYLGGSASSYDVLKSDSYKNGWNLEAENGNFNAWDSLYALMNTINSSPTTSTPAYVNAVFEQVQGDNPDGTPNPNYPDLLNIDNMIDYILLIDYTGNLDAPNSNFLGNENPNNVWMIRPEDGSSGFIFVPTDSEWTLLDPNTNRVNSDPAGFTPTTTITTPQWFFQQLEGSPLFVQDVADHIQKEFFNDGPLSVEGATTLYESLAAEAYGPVVAESARWGDYEYDVGDSSTIYTRDVDWQNQITYIETQYLPVRTGIVLGQLEAAGLFPSVSAPVYSQFGGSVAYGYQLSITNPNSGGTIYYTVDGSDPSTSSTAQVYTNPITLMQATDVKARILQNGIWTPLTDASFDVPPELRVTELNYDPANPAAGAADSDAQDYEFIELQNFGSQTINLQNVAFTNGITYTFGNVTLAPGQVGVLVHNLAAFTSGYYGNTSNIDILGSYQSSGTSFSNSGEEVTLVDAAGTTLEDFTYNPQWFPATQGDGPSLEVIDPASNPNLNLAASWRQSPLTNGTPGYDNSYPTAAPTGLAAVVSNNKTTLTWQAVGGATTYNVYAGNSSGGESSTPVATGLTTPTYTSSTLTPGQPNYYYVTAVDPGGESPPSLEVTTTLGTGLVLVDDVVTTVQAGATITISAAALDASETGKTASQLVYTIGTAPTNGTLFDNGAALTAGSTFTQADINSNLITYTNNGSAAETDSFTFTVTDGAGGSTGQQPFSLLINHAPVVATNAGLSVNPGQGAAITSSLLNVTDSEQGPTAPTYTIVTLPTAGKLYLNGTALKANGTFTQAAINNGTLYYVSTGSIAASDSFAFTVSDGAGGVLGKTTFALNVVPLSSVSYAGNQTTYTQNFDGLPTSGTYSLYSTGPIAFDTSTLPTTGLTGWSFAQQKGSAGGTATVEKFIVSDGAAADTTGGVYSYGAGSDTPGYPDTADPSSDRALGLIGTSTLASTVGVTFVNNSGVTLNQISVSYDGQLWHRGTSTHNSTLTFGYAVGASSITAASTPDANLNYSVTGTGTAAAYDGTATANNAFRYDTISGLNWAPGQTLVLSWAIITSGSQAPGLAIDDFSFSADAAPFVTTNTGLNTHINQSTTLTSGMLNTTDADNTAAQLTYTLTSVPSNGSLYDSNPTLAQSTPLQVGAAVYAKPISMLVISPSPPARRRPAAASGSRSPIPTALVPRAPSVWTSVMRCRCWPQTPV